MPVEVPVAASPINHCKISSFFLGQRKDTRKVAVCFSRHVRCPSQAISWKDFLTSSRTCHSYFLYTLLQRRCNRETRMKWRTMLTSCSTPPCLHSLLHELHRCGGIASSDEMQKLRAASPIRSWEAYAISSFRSRRQDMCPTATTVNTWLAPAWPQ